MKITYVHWILLAPKVTTAPSHVEEPKAPTEKEPDKKITTMGGLQKPKPDVEERATRGMIYPRLRYCRATLGV